MREHGAVKRAAMRTSWALSSLKDWTDYRRRKAEFEEKTRGAGPTHTIDKPDGPRARHTYKIVDGKVLTTFQMDQRWKIVSSLYPEKLTSLLDIGCCRGWFVIQAAMRPECEKALGIDVVPAYIEAANEAREVLRLDNAQFHYAFLDDVVGDPQKYKTPYQTIVLLNVYHYLYWGSSESDKHWADHDYLLSTLASICTDRIIMMSPLEINDCPSDIARRAQQHPEWAQAFTKKTFLETADKYFDVSHQTYLGLRPLYLLKKR